MVLPQSQFKSVFSSSFLCYPYFSKDCTGKRINKRSTACLLNRSFTSSWVKLETQFWNQVRMVGNGSDRSIAVHFKAWRLWNNIKPWDVSESRWYYKPKKLDPCGIPEAARVMRLDFKEFVDWRNSKLSLPSCILASSTCLIKHPVAISRHIG